MLLDRLRETNSVSPVELGRRMYAMESLCCGERKIEDGVYGIAVEGPTSASARSAFALRCFMLFAI